MQYEINYADGSVEVVEAENISEARETATELFACPIRKVVALGEDVDVEENGDDEDGDIVSVNADDSDEDLDDGENPDGEDSEDCDEECEDEE